MDANSMQSPVREERANQEVSTPQSVASDISMEMATPTTPASPGRTEPDHDIDENEADISNTSIATEKAFMMGGKTVATPGPIKARRQLEENKMLNSPSDAMLSPCTAMLMGRGGKKEFYQKSSTAVSGPAAALRKKQMGSIPFKLDE